jgi:hypothetical protein
LPDQQSRPAGIVLEGLVDFSPGMGPAVIFHAVWRRSFQVIWRRCRRGLSPWLADLRTEEPEVGSPPALGLVGAWLYPALGVSSPNDRALSSG